jgi:hypothetical protein
VPSYWPRASALREGPSHGFGLPLRQLYPELDTIDRKYPGQSGLTLLVLGECGGAPSPANWDARVGKFLRPTTMILRLPAVLSFNQM